MRIIKQACQATVDVFSKYLKEQIMDIIDGDKKVKHSKLAQGIEDALRFGFCVLNFLPILSDFFSREKLTQNWLEAKAEQFVKNPFLNDKRGFQLEKWRARFL